ncbi:TonB-dependent receptor domain-containing protein [Mariniflexile ostreae]|uniref:TonB-dependent receptor domain-containing protein n=1 Tax=Mariniflexile ostreae TaxID=1520892 RepID=A0ABV5F886_9FLAO
MKLLFKILLLLAITPIYSQNSIHGVITDSNTKAPIVYANIYIPAVEKGTMSHEKGDFTIDNLPPGKYEVLFSIIGYQTKSITIKIPFEEHLHLSLSPSFIEMKDIIISTPFHKLQRDNVMKVEQENIKNLKAGGAVTLAEGIANIPGVESLTTGLGIGKPVIRGLSSNRVLVYAQGVRLENQQFGAEHGLGINDAGVESIEVIKGPASLLYGSDALGGVLYVNPERFSQSNSTTGDVAANYFSNTEGVTTSAGVKSSTETFKFLFRGSTASHSDYKTDAYRVTNTRFNEQDFKAGIGYQNKGFTTEFRYNVNVSDLGIPITTGIGQGGEQSKNRTPLLPFQNITNHVLSSKSTIFFNKSRLDINLGYIYNDRKEFETPHDHDDHDHDDHHDHEEHEEEHEHEAYGTLDPALHMKLKTANYDIKYNLPKLGKLETIFGVQGMNQINTNYGDEQLIPNARTNDIGILATSHIHFEKADMQLGIRFDNRTIDVNSDFNKSFNSFNAAAGVKTNIAKYITARVNLASGFRAPNLAELKSYGTHEGTNRFEIGNETLKSEQNLQADVALEYTNEHLEVFANVFYNTIKNYIYLSPNGEIIKNVPVYEYFQNNAHLYGGEFGIHVHPHPMDWLHVESNFEMVTGKQNNDDYLPLIPAHTLSNMIRVEFNKKWLEKSYAFVKLKTTFQQNKLGAFETSTKDYSLLSAGFGSTLRLFKKDLLLSISGNNLTNKTYVNHLSRLKSDGIFNIGRNISIGFTYTL